MTDTLLIIIAVLLAVRIVLQLRQGKRAFEKMYQATSEVENCATVVNRSIYHIRAEIESKAFEGWELVGAHLTKNKNEILFFTRKKIKNYLEE